MRMDVVWFVSKVSQTSVLLLTAWGQAFSTQSKETLQKQHQE